MKSLFEQEFGYKPTFLNVVNNIFEHFKNTILTEEEYFDAYDDKYVKEINDFLQTLEPEEKYDFSVQIFQANQNLKTTDYLYGLTILKDSNRLDPTKFLLFFGFETCQAAWFKLSGYYECLEETHRE